MTAERKFDYDLRHFETLWVRIREASEHDLKILKDSFEKYIKQRAYDSPLKSKLASQLKAAAKYFNSEDMQKFLGALSDDLNNKGVKLQNFIKLQAQDKSRDEPDELFFFDIIESIPYSIKPQAAQQDYKFMYERGETVLTKTERAFVKHGYHMQDAPIQNSEAYNHLLAGYKMHNDNEAAMREFENAIKLEKNDFSAVTLDAKQNLIWLYLNDRRFTEAKQLFEDVDKILSMTPTGTQEEKSWQQLKQRHEPFRDAMEKVHAEMEYKTGLDLINEKKYKSAKKSLINALNIFEKSNDLKGKANAMFQIGSIYIYVKRYDLALEYYKNVEQILNNLPPDNQLHETFASFREALQKNINLSERKILESAKNHLIDGEFAHKHKDFALAQHHYELSIAWFGSREDHPDSIRACCYLSRLYFQQQQFDKAYACIQEAERRLNLLPKDNKEISYLKNNIQDIYASIELEESKSSKSLMTEQKTDTGNSAQQYAPLNEYIKPEERNHLWENLLGNDSSKKSDALAYIARLNTKAANTILSNHFLRDQLLQGDLTDKLQRISDIATSRYTTSMQVLQNKDIQKIWASEAKTSLDQGLISLNILTIAEHNPIAAQVILETEIIRDALFFGNDSDNYAIITKIAAAHPTDNDIAHLCKQLSQELIAPPTSTSDKKDDVPSGPKLRS